MKNILFDYGRTIVEHPADNAGLEIVKRRGVQGKEAYLVRNAIFSSGNFLNDLDEGKMSREEYHKLLVKSLPAHLHQKAIEASDYHITELGFIKGMAELIEDLRRDGFKLYITSNMSKLHAEQMYHTEIAKHFDGMIFSSEIKIGKPHREFFEKALERFGVLAQDCLFIDDMKENVLGAKAVGIDGYVFCGDSDEARKFIYNNA